MRSPRLVEPWRTVEYFGINWPAQAVHIDVSDEQAEAIAAVPAGALAVVDEAGRSTPAQLIQRDDSAAVWYVAALGPGETHEYRLIRDAAPASPAVTLHIEPAAAEWRGAEFGVRLAWDEKPLAQPTPLNQLPGPIEAVCGPDGVWFGRGYWRSPALCIAWRCEVIDAGPVVWRLRHVYELADGASLTLEYRMEAATPAVEVTVRCTQAPSGPAPAAAPAGLPNPAAITAQELSNNPISADLVWEPRQPARFEPDHAFWRPHSPSSWRGPKGAWNRQTYRLRWPESPDVISLTAFYNWNADGAMFWSCWPEQPDRRDVLVVGAIRPSRTRCPEPYRPLSIQAAQGSPSSSGWESSSGSSGLSGLSGSEGYQRSEPSQPSQPRLALAVPAQVGQKVFFIGVLDQRGALPERDDAGSGVESLYRQMHCLGLDEYQHMHLDWLGIDQIAFPHLMIAPDELAGVRRTFRDWTWLREQFEAHVDDRLFMTHDQPDMRILPGARTLGSDWAGAYLLTGQDEYAQRAKAIISDRLDRWVQAFAALGPTEDDLIGISIARLWRSTCIAFDLVAASPAFTAAERVSFLRKFAFITEVASTDDAWPPTETGLGRGNPNFHADFLTAKGIAAALLNGHPRQTHWLDQAAAEAAHYLHHEHFDSGCAHEAATYQFVSLSNMILLAAALRHAGRADLFQVAPAMKRAFDYLAASQTPLDPRAGFSLLPTIGHVTGYGWSQSLQAGFAWAAKATAASDPAFSRRMMAAWRRAGRMPISLHDFYNDLIWWPPACLIDRHLPGEPDPEHGRSHLHHGLGAIFRTAHPDGNDGFLLVKMGPSRGHFDPDEGSLYWYAYGQPLLADFGCQYNPNIECAWLHNRISFDRWNETWGYAFKVSDSTFDRHVDFIAGEMTVHRLYTWGDWPVRQTEFDFRLSSRRRDIPPLTWRRSVLYVHACEAVIVRDVLSGEQATDWNLQVLAEEARLGPGSAHFKGQFGVDLDVYFAQPAAPELALSAFEHQGFNEPRLPFFWWKAARWAAPDGACYGPMGERALTLRARAAPGQGYMSLLLARRATERSFEVAVLPEAAGFAWSDGEREWRAMLHLADGGVERWRISASDGHGAWDEQVGGVG